jgi:hypothetical protein
MARAPAATAAAASMASERNVPMMAGSSISVLIRAGWSIARARRHLAGLRSAAMIAAPRPA